MLDFTANGQPVIQKNFFEMASAVRISDDFFIGTGRPVTPHTIIMRNFEEFKIDRFI